MKKNALKQIRESLMLSNAELARKAGLSPITISRIEQGKPCQLKTQRKILSALGLNPSERDEVFGKG